MSDLHQAVELLGATIRRNLQTEDEGLFRMPKIKFIEKKLMEKANQQLQMSNIDEKALLRKIGAHETLTYREERAIPFVLFLDECTMELFQAGVRAMDFQSNGQVRRLFYVYLSQYEDGSVTSIHRTKLQAVERILQAYFQRPTPEHASRLLRMGFQYAMLFFGKTPTVSMMAMMLKCKGVHACYETLGLPRGLYGCGFIRESLKQLFLFPRLSIEEKLRCLEELTRSTDGDATHSGDIYADVYPVAATGIILGVNVMKTAQKQLLKKRCIDLFYDLLGDPRFGARTIRWESVSEEARTIFLHWLAENDVNLFFRIIEKTAVDGQLRNSTNIIDLTGITDIGNSVLAYQYQGVAFPKNTNINLSSLSTISGSNACQSMFSGCSGITSVDLSSLTTISGGYACNNMFSSCSRLTSADLSGLTTISGSNACSGMFVGCSNITSVDLSSLTVISGLLSASYSAMFAGCTHLESVKFGGLKSTTFASAVNQLQYLFYAQTGSQAPNGCTVHFPSNFDPSAPNHTFDASTLAGYPTFGGNASYIKIAFDLPATE